MSWLLNPPQRTAEIVMTASSSPPQGALMCDGSTVSRTKYAALFKAIGTTYGAGDGSTTFALPNLQGRVPMGSGTATGAPGATTHNLGASGGEETHLLTSAESGMPNHSHSASGSIGIYQSGNEAGGYGLPLSSSFRDRVFVNGGSSGVSVSIGAVAANAAQAHNNLQPYAVVNFAIYFM